MPPLFRQQTQDQEAGSEERFHTRQIIYSCALSACCCFSVTYIFLHSPVTHGFSVWLRNGGGRWMQRVVGVGGGEWWPRTAPVHLRTQPGALFPQPRNHQWLPTALCTKSRLLPVAQGGPDILHGGLSCHLFSLRHLSEQGKVSCT